ncbi:MAG: NAD(P)-binding domain-containing protein [Chloroflexi bacterium]|nr:NAD(P)-binding domain-containing protein [Chloroflexota bacterium]
MPEPQHHSIIVIGGGPGGLGVSALLEGWRPRLVGSVPDRLRTGTIPDLLSKTSDDLFSLDMDAVLRAGITPFDLFRILHHPTDDYRGKGARVLGFEKRPGVDWLMLSNEPAGGLWNYVPRNQLTLSPAHWMELAPYPMDDFFCDSGRDLDPNDLIEKKDLVPYYHQFVVKTGLVDRIRLDQQVVSIAPGTDSRRFVIATRSTTGGLHMEYSADFLVFAVGPKAELRRLSVPGEELGYVSHHYDHWDDYPGERIMVVGGGRSADWAATELHDAGRHVTYVMRGRESTQLRLIHDSQHLPYYVRIREIIESGSPRLSRRYGTHVKAFEPGGRVVLDSDDVIGVDHVIVEIGGEPSYGLLRDFGRLSLTEGRDRYRLQLMQMVVDPTTYESVDISRLYPAGYLAAGTGISVLGMHCTAYPMAADILSKLRVGAEN